jgi:hypothetical protein
MAVISGSAGNDGFSGNESGRHMAVTELFSTAGRRAPPRLTRAPATRAEKSLQRCVLTRLRFLSIFVDSCLVLLDAG